MTGIWKSVLYAIYYFAVNVVKCGEIPRHVSLIMDGNRRFAVKNKMKLGVAHSKGHRALFETLKVCLDLGVEEITYYLFSIENFKRTQEQVNQIFDETKQYLRHLLEIKPTFLVENGIRVRVIGNLSLLPPDLVEVIAKIVVKTRNHRNVIVNLGIPYTSQDEITEATKSVVQALEEGVLHPDDVTPELLDAAMYTEDSPPVDIFIRTSGEVRFSDFMLWQSTHAALYFTSTLWPDFHFWGVLNAVILYQRGHPKRPPVTPLNSRMESFLANLYQSRFAALSALVPSDSEN